MSRFMIFVLLLLTLQTVQTPQAEGQIIRRLRERRAAVQAAAAAAPGEEAAAPVPPLRGLLARRLLARQDLVAQKESQPTPASPNTDKPATPRNQLAARRAASELKQASAMQAPKTPNFSVSELANLDINKLQNALADVEGALQNDLNRFSSANSWQGFLSLPDQVLEEASASPAVLETSLDRFNRVASNPEFSQISTLASFEQARGILAELANRTVGPKLGNAAEASVATKSSPSSSNAESTAEQLPAPQPKSPPVRPARSNERERSIVVRSE